MDEITAKLQGMTVFTIVDFKKGYWMVVLHPDSRKLTCMALPFGRFQWTHLPMGIVVAQDIFQSKLDATFIGMEGVTGIADDMIIAGKDEMKHDRNFLAFMEKCMENNLTLNAEKIQFKQSQVSFYGHIWSENGISPDPKKIQALKHMEFPPDKETMRSFLGMINYLNRYSALSAHLAAPLSSFTLPDMEKMPVFLGNQFLQGKEESMDTGTFTLGNIILNRYPALSTLTHQATEPGRVQQNFQQLKMESPNMEALPCFNSNAEATPQMETSKKGPRADSIQNGKDTTVTSSQVTPMDPVDDIQPPARKCISTMNVHLQDSHSSKSD